jgi:Family of unknown function (DUF5995)
VTGISSIDDVVRRMQDISAPLPMGDGVRAFNDMYLATTRQVADALAGRAFADGEFMDRLDVRFAELYFGALDAHAGDRRTAPRCWSALIDARTREGVEPVQFALAGMNAHIAFDLPRALVGTARELGRDLDARAVREDFLAVNEVLAATQPLVKRGLLDGLLADVDRALGQADDRLAHWAIESAREMAWASAQALWELASPRAIRRFEAGLDRLVALTSAAMLRL